MSIYSVKVLEDIVQKMICVAEGAGKVILEFYNHNNFEIKLKQDGSFVSTADLEAEAYIRNELVKILPNISIISEELSNSHDHKNFKCKNFWLVDPIDGTDGFISRNDDFVVNIALIENNKPILGVVHSPVLNKTYFGGSRIGSYINFSGRSIKKLTKNYNKDPILLLYHKLPKNKERDLFLENLKMRNVKRNSNMLRFCRIAEAEVDLHVCFEETKEWDIASGHAILNGCDGKIIGLDFKEMSYGKRDFKNPPFIAHNKIHILDFMNCL